MRPPLQYPHTVSASVSYAAGRTQLLVLFIRGALIVGHPEPPNAANACKIQSRLAKPITEYYMHEQVAFYSSQNSIILKVASTGAPAEVIKIWKISVYINDGVLNLETHSQYHPAYYPSHCASTDYRIESSQNNSPILHPVVYIASL